jgi:hypothetical protein
MAANKFTILLEGIAGAVTIAATVILSPLLRSWYSRWGTTDAEAQRSYPGDDAVPHPKSELTCAITVHAPASCVWPWFVQLGCQRGGWYAYDLLDNGGVPSANHIIPAYQHLKVGNVVKAVPNGSFGFPVAAIVPGKVLTLAGTLNTRTGQPADPHDPHLDAYFSGDQTFVIDSLDERTCRLIFRMRVDWNPSLPNTLIYRGIVEPVSFVMGRKMLRNVKARAEALAATR